MGKKYLFLLCSAVAMIGLSSCHKDENLENIKLTPEKAELYIGDSQTFTADDAAANRWVSASPFIATVDAGKATAVHVGKTYIYAYNGKHYGRADLTVLPRYTQVSDPVTEWWISNDELQKQIGKPDRDLTSLTIGDTELRAYLYKTGDKEITLYRFDSNYKLHGAFVVFPQGKADLDKFIAERLAFDKEMTSDNGQTVQLYINDYALSSATTAMGFLEASISNLAAAAILKMFIGTTDITVMGYMPAQYAEHFIESIPDL